MKMNIFKQHEKDGCFKPFLRKDNTGYNVLFVIRNGGIQRRINAWPLSKYDADIICAMLNNLMIIAENDHEAWAANDIADTWFTDLEVIPFPPGFK